MHTLAETTETTTNETKGIKLSAVNARRLERIFVSYSRGEPPTISPTLGTVVGQAGDRTGRAATWPDVHALKRIGAIEYEDDPSLGFMGMGRYTKITLTAAGRSALDAMLAAKDGR